MAWSFDNIDVVPYNPSANFLTMIRSFIPFESIRGSVASADLGRFTALFAKSSVLLHVSHRCLADGP